MSKNQTKIDFREVPAVLYNSKEKRFYEFYPKQLKIRSGYDCGTMKQERMFPCPSIDVMRDDWKYLVNDDYKRIK